MSGRVLTIFALLACLSGGCTSPAHLQLAPGIPSPAPAVAASATTAVNTCTVRLQPLDDRRKDATSLGAVGGRAVSAGQAAGWIEQELLGLASPRFQVIAAAAKADAALTVTPVLHKLYVDNVAVTKTAVVVLELTFAPREGVVTRRFYRGQHASMNWASNESEITRAVRLALADCLTKIRLDLEARAQAQAGR